MNIHQATDAYERWMAQHFAPVKADLVYKHQQMAASPFPFLRATFYRWMQLWPEVCGELAEAPEVLAVGDLHVDNFGTWRDAEGRLVWGVNDFDEAARLPYTLDLVRLATSAKLAADENHLRLPVQEACRAIVTGYGKGLEAGGGPLVLAEHHGWLREIAAANLRDPVAFWHKMQSLPGALEPVPATAVAALERALPAPGIAYTVRHRIAGVGSLGRPRYVAIAEWNSGLVAREAKALLPSAAAVEQAPYREVLERAVRAPDPCVRLESGWIIRRLAPDCSRIELTALPGVADETRLLHAMGWETANIHLGSGRGIPAVKQDLGRRSKKNWLVRAAQAMVRATRADWQDWRRTQPGF